MISLPQIEDQARFDETVMRASMGVTPAIRSLATTRLREAVRAGKIAADEVIEAARGGDEGLAMLAIRHAPRIPTPIIGPGCFNLAISEKAIPERLYQQATELLQLFASTGDLDDDGCEELIDTPGKASIITVLARSWEAYAQRVIAPVYDLVPDYLLEQAGDTRTPQTHPLLVTPVGLLELMGEHLAEACDLTTPGLLYVSGEPVLTFDLPDWRIEPENQWALEAAMKLLAKNLSGPLLCDEDEFLMFAGYEMEMMEDAALTATWVGDTPIVSEEMKEAMINEGIASEEWLESDEAADQMRYLRWLRGRRKLGKVTIKMVQEWCNSHRDSQLFKLVSGLLTLVRGARKLGLHRMPKLEVHQINDESGYCTYMPCRQRAGLDQMRESMAMNYWSHAGEAMVKVVRDGSNEWAKHMDAWLLSGAIAQLAALMANHAAQVLGDS